MVLNYTDAMTAYEGRYPINPDRDFPDLPAIANLYTGASPERLSLDEYAIALDAMGRLTPVVAEAITKAHDWQSNTVAMVYIAGGLTDVSEELKRRYGQASDLLATYAPPGEDGRQAFFGYVPHLHGTDPVLHPQVSQEEVRDIDFIYARLVPSFTVNFLAPIAHGNAIEAGWGELGMVPGVYMKPTGYKLSRLTLGMNNIAHTIEYEDYETDGLEQLKIYFDEVHAWLQTNPGRDPREFFYLGFANIRTPLLRRAGLNSAGFQPFINVRHIDIYVKNRASPRYGQVGRLVCHDWRESGEMIVEFPDGETEVYGDTDPTISRWRSHTDGAA